MQTSFSFYIGQRLTDYTNTDVTVERIASGGFGSVAMGPDRAAGGQWRALKMLRPDLLANYNESVQERVRALFLHEALIWRGLWLHPNLLTAHFVTRIEGNLVLILDYAENGSLQNLFDVLRRQNRWLTFNDALYLAQQIAAGLEVLHTPDPTLLRDAPIVHRDLKPDNVLLRSGSAVITDFGLSKAVAEAANDGTADSNNSMRSDQVTMQEVSEPIASSRTQTYHTQRGAALGTPVYMAPEQWLDASAAGTAADVYTFGLILVELLTGHHPLLDTEAPHSIMDWREAHLVGQTIPLRQLIEAAFAAQDTMQPAVMVAIAIDRLEQLLTKLLAKQADERPGMAETLAELQVMAMALGAKPYVPQDDAYPNTEAEEMVFWMGWSSAYFEFGLFADALPRIERALAIAPDVRVLSVYAGILAGLGRSEEALEVCRLSLEGYRLVLAEQPNANVEGYDATFNNLCVMLSLAGRYAEAEAEFAQLVSIWPQRADGWGHRALNEKNWAREEAQAGHKGAAQAHVKRGQRYIKRAIALNPHDVRYRELDHLLHLARKVL